MRGKYVGIEVASNVGMNVGTKGSRALTTSRATYLLTTYLLTTCSLPAHYLLPTYVLPTHYLLTTCYLPAHYPLTTCY